MRPLLLPLLSLSGCLVGEITDIPCGGDEQCPTNHFCDVPNELCVLASEGDTPPDLDVTGVVDPAGEVQIDPFVVPGERQTLKLVIANQGTRDATSVRLDMAKLVCMNLAFDPAPVTIAGGEEVEVAFSIEPSGCGTPSIQDWFLFYSGRSKRGTFNINIERQ